MARPKSGEKYEAIMQATLKLVTREGFHGLSMSKIAREADIASATIYVYFEDKEAIINQLYVDLKERVFMNIMAGYKPYMSTRQGFEIIWKNVYRCAVENPVAFSFLEQFANSPYITQVSREEGTRQFRPVNEFFQRAMEKGEIRQLPMEAVMALFYAPVKSLAKYVIAGSEPLDERAMQVVLEATWQGMKT